jgi:hypothetical protein
MNNTRRQAKQIDYMMLNGRINMNVILRRIRKGEAMD